MFRGSVSKMLWFKTKTLKYRKDSRYLKQKQITNGHRTILLSVWNVPDVPKVTLKVWRVVELLHHCIIAPKQKGVCSGPGTTSQILLDDLIWLLKWDPGDLFHWTVGIICPQPFFFCQTGVVYSTKSNILRCSEKLPRSLWVQCAQLIYDHGRGARQVFLFYLLHYFITEFCQYLQNVL